MPASVNQGISLSFDDVTVSLAPTSPSLSTANLKTAAHRGMSEEVVEYRNALGDGVHLQYVPINNGVKENIILDRYPGKNTFNFTVYVGDYYPAYTEGESIPFIDPATDEIALILGQADARDSYTGDETDGHFTLYNSLRVESVGGGKYSLTVTIDNDFLLDPNTVYPVVIDPSYTLPSTSFRDTTVYGNKPTSSAYYTSAYLIVGDHGSAYGEGIAFVQTKKMTDLVNNGIVPEKVTYASYRVYEGSGKTNSSLIQLKGTNANWDQTTITYNNKPTLEGGTYSQNVVDHSGWYTFDVTTQVRNWLAWAEDYSGYSQTRGFALKASNSTASSKHFCSGEYTGNTKPSFIINYVSNVYDINYTYNSSGQHPFKAWGKLINNDAKLYRFDVHTSGTYIMETMGSSFFTNGQTTDTMMELFDQNYNRMLINDTPTTGSSDYARLQYTFSPGTYHILVSDADDSDGAAGTNDSIGKVDGLKCYVIIRKSGELCAEGSFYANKTSSFYKIGEYGYHMNCYGYAIGTETYDTSYESDINELNNQMVRKGYRQSPSFSNNCIIAYYRSGESIIRHFAKADSNGVVSSKMDYMELVIHESYRAYENMSTGFGDKYLFYVKE